MSGLVSILASPKQNSSDIFSSTCVHDNGTRGLADLAYRRKHSLSPCSPLRSAKRERLDEAAVSGAPATPPSLCKTSRALRFSPVDSPSRRQRKAGAFTTASQSGAGAAALAALRISAAPSAVFGAPTATNVHCLALPVPLPAASLVGVEVDGGEADEVDELEGEETMDVETETSDAEVAAATVPSPASTLHDVLAHLHPLLGDCTDALERAGLVDLATLRSLTREEFASVIDAVEGVTILQRALLRGRVAALCQP
jgi:hypothetical protein